MIFASEVRNLRSEICDLRCVALLACRYGLSSVDPLNDPKAHADFIKAINCYNCESLAVPL